MARSVHHAVSLFSNCGAGDLGYAQAGFRFDIMAEIDERRLEVCLLNHKNSKGIAGDLRRTWPKVVRNYRKIASTAPSLLAACPPCQAMSTARSDRGHEDDPDAGIKDTRNLLVTIISKVAKALQPRIIVVENVQAFLTRKVRHPRTGMPVSAARFLVDDLARNYEVYPLLVDLCDFGIPQIRRCMFLTFIRNDEPTLAVLRAKHFSPYPFPTHASEFGGQPIILREALRQFALPKLDASSPAKAASSHFNRLHSVPVWLDRRYAMVAAIPPHTGMSAWENNICEQCGVVDAAADDARCPCCGNLLLRPIAQSKNGRYRLIHGFRSSTYRRMKSDEPASTITTATGHIGSNNTLHPYENRVLSTLECALLQTFPFSFQWGDSLERWGHTNVRAMIGEAVPPLFTRLHGQVLCNT